MPPPSCPAVLFVIEVPVAVKLFPAPVLTYIPPPLVAAVLPVTEPPWIISGPLVKMPPPNRHGTPPLLVTETLWRPRLPLLLMAPPEPKKHLLPERVRLLRVNPAPTTVVIAPPPMMLLLF